MIPVISSMLILFVNLITTDFLSKKKYTFFITYGIIFLFTLTIFLINQFIVPLIPFMSERFMFLIFSWAYLLIFVHLYDHKVKTLIMIMALSLAHTLTINGIAYHTHILLFDAYERPSFIISEVMMLSISTPLMIYLLKKSLKQIIDSLNQRTFYISVLLPLTIFLIITLLRFSIQFDQFTTFIMTYLLITIIILLSYYIIYKLVNDAFNIQRLSTIIFTDDLTKVKNRPALFHDLNQIIMSDNNFISIIFLDLDHLKKINDQYGHLVGDDYIIAFTKAVKSVIKCTDCLYRMSGDEFVILSRDQSLNTTSLSKRIQEHFFFHIAFLGVSIGQAIYPQDGVSVDQLLNIADKQMYENKSLKNKNRP